MMVDNFVKDDEKLGNGLLLVMDDFVTDDERPHDGLLLNDGIMI